MPSAVRIDAGHVLFVGAYDLWGFGGTVSVHYAVGEQRIFFFGGRLALLGGGESGYGGFGGFADADIGIRPRITAGRTGAFAIVFAGGVGGAFITSGALSSPFPSVLSFLHLALRLGPSFDIGAFTLDALAGPSLLVSGYGAGGALECVLEVGVRF